MEEGADDPSVTGVVDLLHRCGAAEEPNEDIHGLTILLHGLQCADLLRRSRPLDVELQVAGLLHDVGHLLAPGAEDLHGRAGADYVRPVFGPRVAALIEGHVAAKRYLITEEPDYGDGLSLGSRRTLAIQGGPLSADEVAAFRALPHAEEIIELRRADDSAKDPRAVVPPLDAWLPVLERSAR